LTLLALQPLTEFRERPVATATALFYNSRTQNCASYVKVLDGRKLGQFILADLNPDLDGVALETFQRLLQWHNQGILQERSFFYFGNVGQDHVPWATSPEDPLRQVDD